jgi:hypothetical protein
VNYAAIRTRVIERMAEYNAGAAAAVATATMSGQTIYSRITECYRDMIEEISGLDPEKLVTTTTLSYAAGESATLPVAVQQRPIVDVEELLTDDYLPLKLITLDQHREYLRTGVLELGVEPRYGYRIELAANKIYVVPKPTTALNLRIRYIAGVTSLVDATDDANSPTLLPEEHHATLALCTALSFLREVGTSPALENEYALKWARFLKWAAGRPKTGVRTVHEI